MTGLSDAGEEEVLSAWGRRGGVDGPPGCRLPDLDGLKRRLRERGVASPHPGSASLSPHSISCVASVDL